MFLFSMFSPLLTLTFPSINPILVQIGPFAIRWYALAYILGILLGWYIVTYLNRKPPHWFSPKALEDMVTYVTLGIILGGRLGYILFYNLDYYLYSPLEILKIWQGGMSFHGGLIGVIIAALLLARKHHLSFLAFTDAFSVVAPIGLGLGRIANFINGELYGRPTSHYLGMVFPYGGPLPRHPSQLYEAFLEGVLLFILLLSCALFTHARHALGRLSGIFLMGYALSRFIVEYFREPDPQIGFIWNLFTMGQLLSVPMFFIGLFVLLRAKPTS